MRHYLRPLLAPASIALVGASGRPGSLGRIVYEHLLAGGFAGAIHAVNPAHREVLGRPAWPTLASIGCDVELAIIATPQRAVARVLESAATANVKVAIVMTSADEVDTEASRAWSTEIAKAAMRGNVRIVGPGALGVIRTPAHLDATYCAARALPGRLAMIAQSGAVATAMLDFAAPLRIGFSTVISVGGGVDIGFGELLDLLLADPQTDGIVVHVEEIADARTFLSALRAAARTKPVVVLKAGRSLEPHAPIPHDAVFDAALRRSGTVRADTYIQLFAAARILSRGRIPQGNRVAIVSNGRGPAVMAADAVADRHLELARLTTASAAKLAALLGHEAPHANPLDVHGDAPPARLADAAAIALADPNVDSVIALHVPRPGTPAVEAAAALARVAPAHRKPLLAAWLGAVDRPDVQAALDAGGIANFYTPETSVDALWVLAQYRTHQAWLLEVPAPQPEPQPPDLTTLETLRAALADAGRTRLRAAEASQVLAVFGLSSFVLVDTLDAAREAAATLHYPVGLVPDAVDAEDHASVAGSARSLAIAWNDVHEAIGRGALADATGSVVVRPAPRENGMPVLAAGIATDPRFGPVIFVAPSPANSLAQRRALMLPPLNARLAGDLLAEATNDLATRIGAPAADALADALTRLAALACALPWVRMLTVDLRVTGEARVHVAQPRFEVEPERRLMRGYPHVAIHPYPVELIGDVALPDATLLHVRPIRPEDAALERAFVDGLSEQSRYYRFFHRLSELTPAMLARFTQVDYDRELALVALPVGADAPPRFVGVARYVANPDRASAEFAVVVADDWQRRGVARVLMRGLIVCAKRRGFQQLVGTVLRENEPMIAFVRSLGFVVGDDPEDESVVCATLRLDAPG